MTSVDAPLALYRRYRPETFAEVIGQEHVTEPLRHALAANRVNHAYLFSGPRGCGKTTSARILARALNCERAPIADPCGECQSCRDLARGGPGSVDVIEIDAASHGGVDDARDLRERAFFAPVESRFKVYIIDEAHMVSTQGFNALLKLVEEPPPHLKFIFATTEPDKVIGTIRSRTHHYPFRLVPPKILGDYLVSLTETEGVHLDPTALPLVVRAGGGSVRDTLSVLDQLLGGAGPEGVTYELAVQLLGFTPDSLLDEIVEAFASSDGTTVFGAVDKVIESGQDPRRFAEDLLQRFRDLIILKAVPNAIETGILDVPGDRADHLQRQVSGFGPSELTRAGDILNHAIADFRGATAPRLLLELMCARILVPGSDGGTESFAARLDRVERRLDVPGSAPELKPVSVVPEPAVGGESGPTQAPPVGPDSPPAEPRTEPPAEIAPAPEPTPEPAPESAPTPAGAMSTADIRTIWPKVLERVQQVRRFTWVMLSQNGQVVEFDGSILTLGLVNEGARDSFMNSGNDAIVAQAMTDVLGIACKVEAIVDPTAGGTKPARKAEPKPEPVEPAPKPTSTVPQEVRDQLANPRAPQADDPDAAASLDDPIIEESNLDPMTLLKETLGAEVIDESSR